MANAARWACGSFPTRRSKCWPMIWQGFPRRPGFPQVPRRPSLQRRADPARTARFTGELRAVGDVLLEKAKFMIRCGFDAFEPADGSRADQWTAAARRFRHVYQRAPTRVARLHRKGRR